MQQSNIAKEESMMLTVLDEKDRNTFMLSMDAMDTQSIGAAQKTPTPKPSKKEVPIPEKALLTLEEASIFTGIGQGKLREISSEDDCPFVLWNGSKRMFKREKLVAFLNSVFSI